MRLVLVLAMGLALMVLTGTVHAGKFGGGDGDGFSSLRSGRMTLNGLRNAGFKFGGGSGDGYAGNKSGLFTPISSVGDSCMQYESGTVLLSH